MNNDGYYDIIVHKAITTQNIKSSHSKLYKSNVRTIYLFSFRCCSFGFRHFLHILISLFVSVWVCVLSAPIATATRRRWVRKTRKVGRPQVACFSRHRWKWLQTFFRSWVYENLHIFCSNNGIAVWRGGWWWYLVVVRPKMMKSYIASTM